MNIRKAPEDMTPLERIILAHKDANQRQRKRSPCLLQEMWVTGFIQTEDEHDFANVTAVDPVIRV